MQRVFSNRLTGAAGILAFATLGLACTRPNPAYCEFKSPDQQCAAGFRCTEQNFCTAVDSATPPDAATDGLAAEIPAPDIAIDIAPDAAPCRMNKDCTGNAATFCDTLFGRCVECLMADNCQSPNKPLCLQNRCAGCGTLGAATNACGARDQTSPHCDTSSGRCVVCTQDAQCTRPAAPICVNSACVACKTDAECGVKGVGPGVCMFHQDGRCATDAETVYVENKSGCVNAGAASGGTRDKPFCHPQDAVARIEQPANQTQRLVLLRGPNSFTSSMAVTATMTIIGQGDATLIPKTGYGLHVIGTAFVRNIAIKNGPDIGVVVEAGSLDLHRVVIQGNAKGGIYIKDGVVRLFNTLIVENGPGKTDQITWGGIYADTSSMPRFVHNTIVNNQGVGLTCKAPLAGMAHSIFHGNASGDVSASCLVTPCCSGDPLLDATYHLKAGSPCIDKVDAFDFHDIDGDVRPQGAKNDCGADEFKKP
jgi:hypothetical protein